MGLVENVAGGDFGYVTVEIAVNDIWSDEGHRRTLVGYPAGWVGAGISVSANGTVYYTFDVLPAKDPGEVSVEVAAPVLQDTAVPGAAPAFTPFVTSTPAADGAIRHTVQPGEALWSIAISYGVTIAEIQEFNGIPADSTVIQVGQVLIIRPAGAAAPSATIAPTGELTPTLTVAPVGAAVGETVSAPAAPTQTLPPAPAETASPTATPTSAPATRPWDNPYFIPVAAIAIGIAGLLIILLSYRK